MEELIDALPEIAATLTAAALILWCLVRPLSFRYRIDSGNLEVLTFFVLPAARIPLCEIRTFDPQAPGQPSRQRVLLPFHLRWLQTPCKAVTDCEILLLPQWHEQWIGAAEPERAFEAVRKTRGELPLFLRAHAEPVN